MKNRFLKMEDRDQKGLRVKKRQKFVQTQGGSTSRSEAVASPIATMYKGLWICPLGESGGFRVKKNFNHDYALHHGSFDTIFEARSWIDANPRRT